MLNTFLWILWSVMIVAALTTAFRTKKLTYGTKKYDNNLWMCAIFNILAIVLVVIRTAIQ